MSREQGRNVSSISSPDINPSNNRGRHSNLIGGLSSSGRKSRLIRRRAKARLS